MGAVSAYDDKKDVKHRGFKQSKIGGGQNMKKRILLRMCLIIFLSCIFLFKEDEINALEGFYKISVGETLFIKGNDSAFVDMKGVKSKIEIEVEITDVTCYDYDGNVKDSTVEVEYGDEDEGSYREYHVKSGETLKFTCYVQSSEDTFIFSEDNMDNFTLNMKVTKIADAKLEIDCHKPITMKDSGYKKVCPKVFCGGEDVSYLVDYKIKASKKNLIDIDYDGDDYFYLDGNYNSGKCKITVTAKYQGRTCSDSFTLRVKSTLKKNLYVFGNLYSYDTRSNIFTMSVFNRSKKKIIVYSKNAVALDDDYVSFDRNVKLSGNKKRIIIKPNKNKNINWKVIGGTTWYEADDFEIHFKCKYKGKTHWLSIQGDYVYVLRKGKWVRMS